MSRRQSLTTGLALSVLFSGTTILGSIAGGRLKMQNGPKKQTADPAAYALLKEAHDSRSAFPAGFAGVKAEVLLNDNGTPVMGVMTYTAAGEMHLSLSNASKTQDDWAREQLESAFDHRRKDDFAHGDGGHPITFTTNDHSPLGRQLALNDSMKSLYRVKDRQILEVTRTMGDMRFTITVLENMVVEGGKYLPSQYVVTYFDAGSGAIKEVEEYTDGYARVGGAWIPVSRRVVTAANGDFTTRTLALRHVQVLGTATAAKR